MGLVGGFVGRGGGPQRGAGVVEELVLEAEHGMGDVVALARAEVGLAGDQGVELALAGGVGVVAELAEDRAGVGPVAEGGEARGSSRAR